MNFNKAIIIGRLTRDPETRSLPSGQSVVSFSIATSNFFTDKSGQKQQQSEFHNIVLFGKLADIASQYLSKGSLALIEGRIQTRTWEDSTGNKKTRTEIVGQSLQLGPRNANTAETTTKSFERKIEATPTTEESIPIIEEGETRGETIYEDEEEEIDVKKIPL